MKPTDKQIEEAAIKHSWVTNGRTSVGSHEDAATRVDFEVGANWAISQMQPEWVTVHLPVDLPWDNKGYWVEDHEGLVQPRDGYTMTLKNTKRYTPVVKPQPPTEKH